jgi:pyrroline-5-carboxylate reductase
MGITFIGGGNMASAIIGGLLKTGHVSAASVRVIDPAADARRRLAQQYDIATFETVSAAAVDSDCIVLAVKPQQMREVAKSLRPLLVRQLVISIAAGIRAQDIGRWLGGYPKIARAMPNTPALVGAGCAGLYALPGVEAEERTQAAGILEAVGTTLWVDREEELDAITALSGSGPAYVFYFIEALQQAGIEMGFEAGIARRLALDTFAGAIKLAQAGDEDVATLRARVTSKGGTTERAVHSLEADDVKRRIVTAVRAAEQRSRELGNELGED